MAHNSDNRKRAFADVVTVDTWHEPFVDGSARANLFADVVFGVARIGGEEASPIRFRLSVKRAEIVVVIPDTEPVSVDRSSVARDAPDMHGTMTEVLEQTTQADIKTKASGSLTTEGIDGSVSLDAAAQASLSKTKKIEISETLQFMLVTQSKTAEGYYRWSVDAHNKEILVGRPWNGTKEPRLKLIDKRGNGTKSLPPTVRVEIRCRREDLKIDNLEIKDEKLWAKLKQRVGFKNRMAAAESYIRDRLIEEGLETNNIEDPFGQLTLASVTAEDS